MVRFVIVLFSLRVSHRLDVCPDMVKYSADFFLTCGKMFVERFSTFAYTFIQVQFSDLLRNSPLYVLKTETTSARVAGLNNGKDDGIGGEVVKESVVRCCSPMLQKIVVEVY